MASNWHKCQNSHCRFHIWYDFNYPPPTAVPLQGYCSDPLPLLFTPAREGTEGSGIICKYLHILPYLSATFIQNILTFMYGLTNTIFLLTGGSSTHPSSQLTVQKGNIGRKVFSYSHILTAISSFRVPGHYGLSFSDIYLLPHPQR